jgi:hypothetical protein
MRLRKFYETDVAQEAQESEPRAARAKEDLSEAPKRPISRGMPNR